MAHRIRLAMSDTIGGLMGSNDGAVDADEMYSAVSPGAPRSDLRS